MPGEYPGRTAHIHVKIQAPGKPVLTTQLYSPRETGNHQDSIFGATLLMEVDDSSSGTFTIVLDLP